MNTETLSKILRMLETAEASLKSVRSLISELDPTAGSLESPMPSSESAKSYEQGENQIIEGTFDGQNMVGPNGKIFPVPANYASKSKLVEGDRLKLTILPNGAFLYKQIAPIPREFIKGVLTKEEGQYRVLAGGKAYRVLLASVTYYKGTVGDEVTLIIPKGQDCTWATIEAIIPQITNTVVNEAEVF